MESNTESTAKRDREEFTHNNNMDNFLASMTFAGTGPDLQRGGCDCDECGGAGGLLPQTIIEAIRKHKRVKAETGPMKRTQQRDLVKRCGQISVYQLTMPVGSEPLVEFGTTHRLVWIRHLSCSGQLWSIGKGIVGSQDEEKGRTDMGWKEDEVYLVPSNGGKAVAWVHNKVREEEKEKKTTASSTGGDSKEASKEEEEKKGAPSAESKAIATSAGGHAVLYVCKIPKDSLEVQESEGNAWHDLVRDTCKEALNKLENGKEVQFQRLSEESAGRLREALSSL